MDRASRDGRPLPRGILASHQVPLPGAKKDPVQLRILEKWMRSQMPEQFFEANGGLAPVFRELAPKGTRRMSANPHTNGGRLKKALRLPDFREYANPTEKPGLALAENTRPLGRMLAEIMKLNPHNFRVFGPDETTSNKLDDIFAVSKKFWIEERFPEDNDGGNLSVTGGLWKCSASTRWRGCSKDIC